METQTSRRALITTGLLTALGWAARPALSAIAIKEKPRVEEDEKHVLVSIFMRGGADGLSVIPPYAEDDYYRARPTLGLAAPNSGKGSPAQRIVDLDGHFGLHPMLAPLLPIYQAGELAIIHACGSGDQTRSHFEAMATMERGLKDDSSTGLASGWLARHLNALDQSGRSSGGAIRAVAIADTMPQSLAGATGTTVMRNVSELRLDLPFGARNFDAQSALDMLYAGSGGSPVQRAGAQSLALLRELADVTPTASAPRNGAAYPKNDDLADGLQQVAVLIRSRIGLEVACLDHMGYDTHVAQGSSNGILAGRLESLSKSLAAFRNDLGPALWARTTVVLQTEFGRRVAENSGLGTDHGRAGVMMVMGGSGVHGGKVWGDWPTLAPDKLEGPGDLHVTTDFRNVLAEVLANRCGQAAPTSVFPGLQYRPLGIVPNA